MNDWILKGICGNAIQRRPNRFQKLMAEARTLALIPDESLVDIGGRRGPD
jgi:hypothetical protein